MAYGLPWAQQILANRSFGNDDEANMNVYDQAFANRPIAGLEADLKRSRLITYAAWRDRPWTDHLLNTLASTLGSQP